jgi:hypothetical protein
MLSKQRVLIVGSTLFFSLVAQTHVDATHYRLWVFVLHILCLHNVCFQVVIESITGPKCV